MDFVPRRALAALAALGLFACTQSPEGSLHLDAAYNPHGRAAATQNLVTNGDFETGTFSGWTKVSYDFVVTSPIHSGTYSAQVGSRYGTYAADMNISQAVAVPAAGATLSFYWYPVCHDTIDYDWQTVELRDTTGHTLATVLKACDNSQVWKSVSYDLTPWAGKTVVLWFNDHDDGWSSSDATWFYLDDVAVTPKIAGNDFSVAVSPASQSVADGASIAYTVSTAVTSGSAQAVALSVAGLPAGLTGSFNPASVTAGASSTLTLSASSSAAAATATFTVTGAASSGSHAASAQVSVTQPATNDFSMSVSPASATIAQGSSATYTVSTAVVSGSSQTVSLSVSGLPSGVTGSFNPASVAAGSSSTLTVTASSTAPATSATTFTVAGAGASASHTASAQVAVTASSGTGVGPNGGSVDQLYFAVIGDTRPGTLDDTANYPTAIATKIYQDMQAMSPRPQFVVGTGDYMFASTTGSEAQPQMNLYLQARQNYTGTVFASIGNHECDGYTADNCTPGQTTNYNVFMNGLVTPLGKSNPYYTVNINSTTGAWTSKLIIIACNVWSATQKSWLQGELAKPTTYTILARHEPAASSTGPCVSDVETLMTQYPYNLSLVGHTHTFRGSASSKEVVVGTGGAPLSSTTVPYGYATVQHTAAGWLINQYDYSSALSVSSFTIP